LEKIVIKNGKKSQKQHKEKLAIKNEKKSQKQHKQNSNPCHLIVGRAT
jgi:hypothetical protein